MSEKRFAIVHKEFLGYTRGYAYIIRDNSIVCEPHRWRQWSVWEDNEDVEDLCDLLNEQQATISRLEEENDNMNLFIKQTIEPLLFNCVFELNTIESMSQVELAEKIEDEIIPFIQDFKYLKYESLEEEKQDKSE